MKSSEVNAVSDWGTAELATKHTPRLIFRSEGEEKVGKDHFGLTMPGPYVKFQFDPQGIEGVADKFLDEKEIRIFNYKRLSKRRFRDKQDGSKAQDEAKKQRDQFLDDIQLAIDNGTRSISVDETDVWKLFRFAEFGAASNAPKNYEVLNDDYYGWFQAIVDSDANLQLVQKMKDQWGNYDDVDPQTGKTKKKPYATGLREPNGWNEAKYAVQANLKHTWERRDDSPVFTVEIINCRQNMEIAGTSYEGYTFPDVTMLVFPATSIEEWI